MSKTDIIAVLIGIAIIVAAVVYTPSENKTPEEEPKEENQEVVEEDEGEKEDEKEEDKKKEDKEEESEQDSKQSDISQKFIDCLEEAGVVVYGAEWCPHCSKLVESLGGYEMADPIYVECSDKGTEDEKQQCEDNSQTDYVPEIQIEGEVKQARTPERLAELTGCEQQ